MMFDVPFMTEQQLPVQVLVAWCLHAGAIQSPGQSTIVCEVSSGLTGQRWVL